MAGFAVPLSQVCPKVAGESVRLHVQKSERLHLRAGDPFLKQPLDQYGEIGLFAAIF